MNYFVEQNTGAIYSGVMMLGDHKATPEEVTAWNASRAPKAIDQIRALESAPTAQDAEKKALRQFLLATWFARAKALPAAAGMTDAQIEAWCRANDKIYKTLAELEDAVKPLRALVA